MAFLIIKNINNILAYLKHSKREDLVHTNIHYYAVLLLLSLYFILFNIQLNNSGAILEKKKYLPVLSSCELLSGRFALEPDGSLVCLLLVPIREFITIILSFFLFLQNQAVKHQQ